MMSLFCIIPQGYVGVVGGGGEGEKHHKNGSSSSYFTGLCQGKTEKWELCYIDQGTVARH